MTQEALIDDVKAKPVVSLDVIKVTPVAQNYEWGRVAENSEVAKLLEASGQPVDRSKPYAELWMGTHPSGPSRLAEGDLTGTELLAYIRDNPDVLGEARARFGADLPFLLKVLSVRTALSIQSHPDKALAERLHAEQPNDYKDANHKPEMALALSDFQAMCGFAPHDELVAALTTIPELRECCGTSAVDAYVNSTEADRKDTLREIFTGLMTANPEPIKAAVEAMCSRLEQESTSRDLSDKESLVLTLQKQYPGDVGVLAAWFLNFITLKAGQAIALPANEPHAYIAGEIIECMATSDNVIRAGLTPKYRDTAVLCSSLTYNQGKPVVMEANMTLNGHLKTYRPASDQFGEFEVSQFEAAKSDVVSLPAANGAMMLLVQQGKGVLEGASKNTMKRGDVFFIPAHTAVTVKVDEDVVAWFAAANSMGF